MFLTEEEKVRETTVERDRRRAASGMDRRGLNQLARTVALIFGGLLLVVAVDVARLERRLTTARVESMADRGNARHGFRCVTQLATTWGEATVYTHNHCRYASWHVDDEADVVARKTRLTHTLVVGTRGTIFAGAYSMLPEW